MHNLINKIKSKAKMCISALMTMALCITSLGLGNVVTAQAVDSSIQSVATVMPEGTGKPNGIAVKLNESTWNESRSSAKEADYLIEDDDGNHRVVLPRQNGTFDDVATLVYEDVATMNGQSVDATLDITKVVVRNINTGSTTGAGYSPNYNTVFRISDSQFLGGADLKDVTFSVKLTYHGTDNEVIGFPCWLEAIDLDTSDIQIGMSDTYTYTESYTVDKSKYDAFYVWQDCALTASQNGDDITFQAQRAADSTTDDDARYYEAGFIAATSKGEFDATIEVASGCGNILYTFVSSVPDPTKTVTSTGSNSDGSYAVGDTVEFEVEQAMPQLYKDAYSAYDSISMRDILPDGLTYQSATMYINGSEASETDGALSYDEASKTITYKFSDEFVADLTNYNGQPLKMVVTATVDTTDEASVDLTNTAYTNVSDVDFGPATATVTVKTPKLSITKSADKSTYNVNDTIDYTIQVQQTTDGVTAKNVVVSDPLPSGLTAVGEPTVSGVSGTASVSGNTITADIPELAYGETAEITVQATVGSSLVGQNVDNTATASDDFGNEETDTSTVEILRPDVNIEKSIGSGPFNVGDTATYTLTVTQPIADAVAFDVVVTDDLPSGLTATGNISLSGVDGDASVNGNTYKVEIPTLKYGETATIEVETTIDASAVGETIDNVATVKDSYDDTDTSDAPIEVLKPELSITKKADATAYSIGDTVTYSIVVNQVKDGAIARNVVVTDTVPDQLELVSVDTSMGDASTSGNSFTVNCGDMSTSDTATITVTATALTESEDIVNTAYANADYTDEVSDEWKIAIRKPGLNIYKDADGEKYYPGDSVEYTLLVSNLIEGEEGEGNVPTAYNVVVSDTLPDGLTLVDVTAEGGTVEKDGNSFTVTYESMYYKAENTIKVTATVNDDVDNTTITNVATVKSDSTDPVDDYAEIDVIKPHLSIEKNADKDVYSVGGQAVYTIDVKQTIADLTAENVVITDILPDEMELVSAELSGIEGDVSVDGNSFTVNAPALAFGETATVTVTANAKTANDSVVNTANADADHADPVSDDADVTILQPVLGIEKDVDKENHYVGDSVVYTINVSETIEGGEAYDVVVSDTLPDGLELKDVSLNDIAGDIAIDGNSFTVSYDKIDSVNAAIITVEATALEDAANTTLNNAAYASASNAEEVSDDADVYIGQPGLEISKTADKDTYEVGENVKYTVTVAETVEGTSETNVTIYDELPDGLTIIGTPELSGADGSVSVSGNEVSVDIPELFYGEDAVLTIEAEAGESLAGETVTNTAYATGDHVDEISDDADISVVKPGETVDPDDPESTETPTSSSDPGETGSGVQTGDNSMMYILLGVAAILLMGGAYVLIQRRRRTE